MPGSLFSGSLIPSGIRTVYASFSGGADSLALLSCLSELKNDAPWELRAVHFEHGIRGTESLGDAEFCRDVCKRLGIPLQIVPLHVPDRIRPGEGTEAAARRLRQEAWGKIIRETVNQPAAVALGHNADDRIESLFLRLMRGSNLSGLHALHAVRTLNGITWIRPLLEFSRTEIEAYLADRSINAFRTDSTNLENDYDRNKLRNTILPALYREFPRARAGILTALHAIADDAEALDRAAEDALRQAIRPGGLDLESLQSLQPALLPRVLRLWTGNIPDRHLVERLRVLLDDPDGHAASGRIPAEGGSVFLWGNGLLRKEDESCSGPEHAGPVVWDYRSVPVLRFGKTVLRFRGETSDGSLPSEEDAAVFHAESFPGRLQVSVRQSSDAMTPFGAAHSVPLKKIFTNAHISAAEQILRPVVRDAARPEEILWVPGVRRSAFYPLDPGKPSRGLLFSSERLVDVTAAVIGGPDGRILVCSRPAGTHMAGKWEFPGGKIEPGETAEACIRREIREELGMEIAVGPVLTVMEHDYGEKYVRVTFFSAISDDDPAAKDNQEFRWISFEELSSVDFLDADRPVSEEIRKKSKKIAVIYNKMRQENVKWLSKQP